jgi:hypothetical protein
MELDVETLELLEELRKKLDLVEAYWYFVEHGADAFECGLALNTLAKFQGTAAPEVRDLVAKLHHNFLEANGFTSTGLYKKEDSYG